MRSGAFKENGCDKMLHSDNPTELPPPRPFPNEVFLAIIQHLPISSILKFTLLSHSTYVLINSTNSLWKQLCGLEWRGKLHHDPAMLHWDTPMHLPDLSAADIRQLKQRRAVRGLDECGMMKEGWRMFREVGGGMGRSWLGFHDEADAWENDEMEETEEERDEDHGGSGGSEWEDIEEEGDEEGSGDGESSHSSVYSDAESRIAAQVLDKPTLFMTLPAEPKRSFIRLSTGASLHPLAGYCKWKWSLIASLRDSKRTSITPRELVNLTWEFDASWVEHTSQACIHLVETRTGKRRLVTHTDLWHQVSCFFFILS